MFSGTAVGSLSSGKLDGRVTNDTKEHTFIFKGSFEDGALKDTGTLQLAR